MNYKGEFLLDYRINANTRKENGCKLQKAMD